LKNQGFGKNEIIQYSDIQQLLQKNLVSLEQLMLSQVEQYHPDLKAVVNLVISAGGKRIRPRIILIIGSLFDAPKDKLQYLAASIEMLHTATLVHDDLIDGSILRRGVPTLNSRWSPAATVLTGDFVFASAAHLASLTDSIEVMSIFSKTLMTIVGGEVNQLFPNHNNPNKEDYYRRIYAKTASLFETSALTAAIISHLPRHQIETLRKFGYELGMAFQIADDILDYCGNESEIGKPVGGDLAQGILTLPLFYFMEHYPDDKRIIDIRTGKNIDNETILQLVSDIAASVAIKESIQEAKLFIDRAQKCLLQLPESPERSELNRIASFVLNRKI
jgi:geranylgeranyl pyrophosphate synthase